MTNIYDQNKKPSKLLEYVKVSKERGIQISAKTSLAEIVSSHIKRSPSHRQETSEERQPY